MFNGEIIIVHFNVICCFINVISFNEAFGDLASNGAITFIGISIISNSLIETGFLKRVCDILLKKSNNNNQLVIYILLFSFFIAMIILNKITIMFALSILFELSKNEKFKILKRFPLFILLASCIGGLVIVPSTSVLLTSSNLLINNGYDGYNTIQYNSYHSQYYI